MLKALQRLLPHLAAGLSLSWLITAGLTFGERPGLPSSLMIGWFVLAIALSILFIAIRTYSGASRR